MTAATTIAVALAGALGAAARFGVEALVSQRSPSRRPWGTMAVNISGSLILGVLVGFASAAGLPEHLEIAVGGGFLGAYTTFSTWMVQAVEMAARGRGRAAALHIAGSVLAGVAAAALGLLLGTRLG